MSDNKQRRVLVTGGNTGIGYFTALELVKQGDHVTLACRNLDKANAAAKKIRDTIADAAAVWAQRARRTS